MSSIIIKLSSEIQTSNFEEWKQRLVEKIETTQLVLRTDNDFVVAGNHVKEFQIAEKAIKNAQKWAFSQNSEIQKLFDDMEQLREKARQTRLKLSKQIKLKKEQLRDDYAHDGVARMINVLKVQSDDFNLLDNTKYTEKDAFLDALKGVSTDETARLRIDDLCTRMENHISQKAIDVENKAKIIDAIALGYSALFTDRCNLLGLTLDDLNKEIESRINTHNANQERIKTKPIIEDEISNETIEEFTSEDEEVPLESEEIAEDEFMDINQTKEIISKLIHDKNDSDFHIVMALKTCLRLIEDEISRRNGKA